MMRTSDFTWSLGVATLSDVDADGFIGIQPDGLGRDEDTGLPPYELQHTFGFASRPVDPDSDGTGCAVLWASEGDDSFAWLGSDPRAVAYTPPLEKGASVQYADSGAFGMFGNLADDDGTFTQYVPCRWDSSGGVLGAHLFQSGLDSNGKRVINIIHADGFSICMHETDGIQLRTIDAETFVKIEPENVTIQAKSIMLRGNVVVGSNPVGAIPLLPGVASPPCPTLFLSAV